MRQSPPEGQPDLGDCRPDEQSEGNLQKWDAPQQHAFVQLTRADFFDLNLYVAYLSDFFQINHQRLWSFKMTRCYGCRDPLASTDLTTRISKPSREIVFCWRCAEEKIFHQFCIESVKQHRAAKKVRNQEIDK